MNKVIIIGGGVAGLTAGIYCENNGISCEIFEKNAFCGGNLTGWKRNGFYIDNCFHWLTGTLPDTELYRIWREIGMITDLGSLYQPNVFYESIYNGQSIAFSRYPEVTRLNMLKLSPTDADEIDRFIDSVEAVGELMREKIPSPAIISAYSRYRRLSLGQLSEKFRHPLLKKAFTDYFGEYFSAIALIWAYGAFICGNGMIPRGGSRNAAKRIENRFTELGGRVHTGKTVKKIVLSEKRAYGILMEDGEFVRADAVVCACDPSVTFGRLLSPNNMPRAFRDICSDNTVAPVFSSIHAAFSVSTSKLPRFGTRVIPCPISDDVKRIVIKEYAYETDFSPEGSCVVQAMLFVNSDDSDIWISEKTNREKYSNEKNIYAEAMRNAIMGEFMLSEGDISLLDVWTPATYHEYFGATHGSYMAFALTPKTPLKRYSCRLKGLSNVFMATQWQCSPGGLPNAARSGKQAAEAVRKLF